MAGRGRVAGLWALLGVAGLFGFAVFRLGRRGMETVLAGGLSPFQWSVLVLSVLVFGLGEGVLALQKMWVPRVIERARYLVHEGRTVHRLLAPMYAMELVGAERRGLIRGWGMIIAIAILAFSVQLLPDPWRGIIDLGVAVALGWALIFILLGMVRLSRSVGRGSDPAHVEQPS